MLFSRQSNDATNESYYALVRRPPFITSALALTVTAATLFSAAPGVARPSPKTNPTSKRATSKKTSLKKINLEKTTVKTSPVSESKITGVWGWTTGSQTYLRVRPSVNVPAVAKVPRHTKLFVWGTFKGWYRVETPDHVFGWIFNQYVNAPHHERLEELSHRKAKAASDRAAHQIMYGSPDLLLRYYAQFGAPGAQRGLKQQGYKLAATSKPKITGALAKSPGQQATPRITSHSAAAPRPRTPASRVAGTTVGPPRVKGSTLQLAPRVVEQPKVAPKAALRPVQAAKPKAAKPSWRAIALKQRQLRQQRQREQLRRQLGTPVMAVPPTVAPQLPPISPEELMKAREAYVNSRNGSNAPAARPNPSGSTGRGNGGPSDANVATLQPSSYTGKRKASPRSKPALNRGGSPRDYLKHSAKQSQFSQGFVDQAMSYRGMPYIRGAESPRRGSDCSGLVYFLLRQRGYNPPRTAAGYVRYGQAVPKGKLQPGDILLFANTYKRGISHMGIYVGNGRFVHAARTGRGVRVDALTSNYYGHKFYGARRVKSK